MYPRDKDDFMDFTLENQLLERDPEDSDLGMDDSPFGVGHRYYHDPIDMEDGEVYLDEDRDIFDNDDLFGYENNEEID